METDKISREQVLHVANLGRLAVKEQEIERYQYQLKDILDEIEKINNAQINDLDSKIIVNPSENIISTDETIPNSIKLRDDIAVEMLNVEDVLKNANKKDNNYIEVIGVINE